MTKRIFDLDLTRIDRVDKGSNPGSKIVFWKSHADKEPNVAKATFDDLLAQAHGVLKDGVEQYGYIEHVDADSNVAVYRNYEGERFGVQLKRSGDTYEMDGDPFAVVMEFRPVNKSGAPASGEGEATVPITKDDLNEETLALFAEVEKERDDAVAKAEADAAEIVALKEAADTDGDSDETDIFKGLSDEAREAVEKAQATAADAEKRIAKMEDERATDRFTAVAKSLGHTGEEADEIGGVLKTIAKAIGEDSDEFKSIVRLQKAAQAQSEKAMEQLAKAAGTNGVQFDGAEVDQLTQLAKAYQVDHGVDYGAALAAVIKDNTALAAEYEKARDSRAGK